MTHCHSVGKVNDKWRSTYATSCSVIQQPHLLFDQDEYFMICNDRYHARGLFVFVHTIEFSDHLALSSFRSLCISCSSLGFYIAVISFKFKILQDQMMSQRTINSTRVTYYIPKLLSAYIIKHIIGCLPWSSCQNCRIFFGATNIWVNS